MPVLKVNEPQLGQGGASICCCLIVDTISGSSGVKVGVATSSMGADSLTEDEMSLDISPFTASSVLVETFGVLKSSCP